MKHHRKQKAQAISIERVYVLAVIACILAGLLFFFELGGSASARRSVEVSFTDAANNGLEIVPASCASPPPGAPSNGAGYEVYNGVSNAEVNTQGYNFCVTNSGGPAYFVPINSQTEIGQFYNAINNGQLPGVSQGPNQ